MKRFIGVLFIGAIALELIHIIGWAQYWLNQYTNTVLAKGEPTFYHPFLRIDIAGQGLDVVGDLAIAFAGLAVLLAAFHGLRGWLLATSATSLTLWATTYGLTNDLQMTALWVLGFAALVGAFLAPLVLVPVGRRLGLYKKPTIPDDASTLKPAPTELEVS